VAAVDAALEVIGANPEAWAMCPTSVKTIL
jgi:hypothetical protein